MVSSYFTRPKGLHPTPSACFPPPQPTGRGTITWNVFESPPMIASPGNINVVVEAFNDFYPLGTPLTVVWNVPNGVQDPVTPVTNGGLEGHNWNITGPPGFYSSTVKVTWPNGQTRTATFSYTITPL